MRAYVFVDAENHFLRSTAVLAEIGGSKRAAQALSTVKDLIPGIRGFPDRIEGGRIGWNPDLQLLWDCYLLSSSIPAGATIVRAIYVGSCAGDEDKAHDMRVKLRSYEFEPIVIREAKNVHKQRESIRNQDNLIEKPKGCDIALATRMVEDASSNLFDCCLLFTSDADFLPAIEAVRRMGKVVWVYGVASNLSARSPYLHVPDKFIDLRRYWQSAWSQNGNEAKVALRQLDEALP